MFQIVPCVTADLSWTFHENQLIHYIVILLTDTPQRLDWRPWNSLGKCETFQLIISCVVPDIAWQFHENPFTRFFQNITNKHGSRKNKNRTRIQGIICNILKTFQGVPCLRSALCWKFHENPFDRFPAILLTDTDIPQKVEKEFLCSRG